MQTIDNYNFKNKKALIRVDFNVPLNEKFEITDDTRMRAAIPTIKKVLAGGGSVILMSHLGRPKNGPEDKFSLKHIQKHLEECGFEEVGGDFTYIPNDLKDVTPEQRETIDKMVERLEEFDDVQTVYTNMKPAEEE